ncbi:MAG: ferredoxin [Candidatus Raymondbacteria bacterium RifOxyC12_full_50_8]|uniref:Ferredoxin n=1 Tax=Candidatus Raymondbacteria bacterium RIFOXYD12_FULL_49_13 TaxID=1817890 RepID=A0A1F7FLH6_UNCRA|nr:MAG: ferredoxin [Candidatus Raymondbacteria bacterium RIFOXYA2_FULL_49_16]OGK07488.1 MAG: ferredoxin [Candidatus Raymondbacteria bacterium RIFOXYD12_FULL_49_13]OGK07773.1 MAG: ferredoxin [Candidatus Raymondbacteria bacterium RifOxyC12_full_50_8]OGP43844.1 MAG: ferredoxin [Candidatus Raymondbacteria bacterium RIFOXYB2_FULL_49_35]
MADRNAKIHGNAAGRYFVDTSCSACNLCAEIAPDNFKLTSDGTGAIVIKQPQSPGEEEICKEAKENCPSEAIGDNG